MPRLDVRQRHSPGKRCRQTVVFPRCSQPMPKHTLQLRYFADNRRFWAPCCSLRSLSFWICSAVVCRRLIKGKVFDGSATYLRLDENGRPASADYARSGRKGTHFVKKPSNRSSGPPCRRSAACVSRKQKAEGRRRPAATVIVAARKRYSIFRAGDWIRARA
jgi:hypothetical protein